MDFMHSADTAGCWYSDRLTLANEHDRRLVAQGLIQLASRNCYELNAAMSEYQCLGLPNDLKIKIYYNED
jgi:hypothetical protein